MATLGSLPGISVGIAVDATGVASGIRQADADFRRFGQNADRAGRAISSGFGSRLQQVSFQVQDFAVQVGSGTSAMRAFAIQAPQMLGAFGPGGAAVGAIVAVVGGSATALFSSRDAAAAWRRRRAAIKVLLKIAGRSLGLRCTSLPMLDDDALYQKNLPLRQAASDGNVIIVEGM